MTTPRTRTLLLLGFLASCTGDRADYRDAPDLAALRVAFACDGERDEGDQRACDVLEDFAGAGALRHPEGREVYIGESHCAGVESHAFDVWILSAGGSSSSAPTSRRPAGDVARCTRSFHPRYREATARTLAALRQGAETPGVESGGAVPSTWAEWATPCSPSSAASTSDGASLLFRGPGSTPRWWDDAPPRPPAEYLRQDGDTLYFARPSRGSNGCVTRAYRVPSI